MIGATLICSFLLAVAIFGAKDIMSTLDEAWYVTEPPARSNALASSFQRGSAYAPTPL